MTVADRIAGEWVADIDMHPATNIMGRRWWARGDIEGVYSGDGSLPRGLRRDDLWWHFPREESAHDH